MDWLEFIKVAAVIVAFGVVMLALEYGYVKYTVRKRKKKFEDKLHRFGLKDEK